jgi:hypothetical protein
VHLLACKYCAYYSIYFSLIYFIFACYSIVDNLSLEIHRNLISDPNITILYFYLSELDDALFDHVYLSNNKKAAHTEVRYAVTKYWKPIRVGLSCLLCEQGGEILQCLKREFL